MNPSLNTWRLISSLVMALSMCACAEERAQNSRIVTWTVYAAGVDGRIYELDADSLHVTDSILIISRKYSMISRILVSPDGRNMYIHAHEYPPIRHTIYHVDTRTRSIISEVEGFEESPILVDKGNILVVNKRYRDSQRSRCLILDIQTLAVVDSFPIGVRVHRASVDSRIVPVEMEGESKLRLLDLRTRTITDEYDIPKLNPESNYSDLLYDVLLHEDQRTVLIARQFAFEIGDVSTGRNLVRVGRMREQGEIAITEDGLTALVAYPSVWWTGTPDRLDVYDVTSGNRQGSILSERGNLFASGRIALLPDRQRALTCADPGSSSVGEMHVIDVQTMTIAESRSLPEVGYVTAIAVGRRP